MKCFNLEVRKKDMYTVPTIFSGPDVANAGHSSFILCWFSTCLSSLKNQAQLLYFYAKANCIFLAVKTIMRVGHFDISASIASNKLFDDIESQRDCDSDRFENPNSTAGEDSYSDRIFTSKILRSNLKKLKDPEVFREYESSKKSYFNIISMIPTLVIIHIFVAVRYNWSHIADESPFFSVAHALLFVCIIVFWPYMISHCIIYSTVKEKRDGLPYRISKYILRSFFGGRIEDILLIFGTLSMGFTLLSRVFHGQCESTTDFWESQR